MNYSKLLGVWRFFLVLAVHFTLFTIFYLLSKINSKLCYFMGRCYLRAWNYVLGHRVIIRGEVTKDRPTLFCVNHISYLDITTVGPHIKGRFIAKAQVKDWPLFGYLATLHGSIYVDRTRQGTAKGLKELNEAIEKKDNLILFPEGTTTDGCRVLPFRSSYFDVAMKHNLTVQPVSLSYAGWDGMPMPRYLKKIVGWFSKDMDMLPHLWQVAQLGKIQAVLTFHPPLKASDFPSRKELAQTCQKIVNQGLSDIARSPIYEQAA